MGDIGDFTAERFAQPGDGALPCLRPRYAAQFGAEDQHLGAALLCGDRNGAQGIFIGRLPIVFGARRGGDGARPAFGHPDMRFDDGGQPGCVQLRDPGGDPVMGQRVPHDDAAGGGRGFP